MAWGRGRHKSAQDKADLIKLTDDMKDFYQIMLKKFPFLGWSDDHWSKANLRLPLFHRGRFNVG